MKCAAIQLVQMGKMTANAKNAVSQLLMVLRKKFADILHACAKHVDIRHAMEPANRRMK